jgi:hypothetical protein
VKQVLDHYGADDKDYVWYKINICTIWTVDGRLNVLIFDPLSLVKRRLSPIIETATVLALKDPYWFYAKALEEVVKFQDEAVWTIRTLVRNTELVGQSFRKARLPLYLHAMVHRDERLPLFLIPIILGSMMSQDTQPMSQRL